MFVGGVVTNNTYGTNDFTFNGGTLKAGNTKATFMSGLTHAYVSTYGAFIDSNGKNIGISQALLHAGSGADGGLTNLGGGTLGSMDGRSPGAELDAFVSPRPMGFAGAW